MDRQIFIDTFGNQPFFDINLMDDWAELYTDQTLFWQAQYARFYAKEMFDIAVALDKDEKAWTLADNTEIFAKFLESLLFNKPSQSIDIHSRSL
jgi:hypothetical protein